MQQAGTQVQQKSGYDESRQSFFAIRTKPKELQPVFGDLISRFASDGFNQSFEIIAFEDCRFPAFPA
jgi:hypothetical protein